MWPERAYKGLWPVALAAIVLAASFIGGWWDIAGGWPLRLAALAVWVAVTVSLLGPRPVTPFATPSYLLPSLALFLYVLIPAAFVSLVLGGAVAIGPDDPPSLVRQGLLIEPNTAVRAVHSVAELLILRFAVLGLAVVAMVGRRAGSAKPAASPSFRALGVVAMVGIVAAILYAVAVSASWAGAAPRWAVEARTVAPVLYLLALSQLTLWCISYRRRAILLASLPVLAGSALLAHGAVKAVTLGVAVLVLVVLFSPSIPPRWRIAAAIGAVSLAIVGQTALLMQRVPANFRADPAGTIASWLPGKYVYRQAETTYCLAHVLREDQAGPDKTVTGLTALVASLVPRVLWPEKPALSNGGAYAVRYCGRDANEVAAVQHSSSITLLGEPIILAGPAGAWLSIAALLAILALLSRHAVALGRGTPAILAVSPWLIDFDQPAALYLANGVKLGLVAAIAVTAIAVLSPRRKA